MNGREDYGAFHTAGGTVCRVRRGEGPGLFVLETLHAPGPTQVTHYLDERGARELLRALKRALGEGEDA